MYKSNARLALIVAIALSMLGACSDPRTASKSNFEKAAAAYYKSPGQDRFCFPLPETDAMLLMFFGSGAEDKDAIVVKAGDRNEKRLDALVAAGLVDKETRPTRGNIQSYRYRLTTEAVPFQNAGKKGLCYAKVKLSGVKDYTEPAPLLGQTVSQVTLKLGFEEIADWMKDRTTQTLWLGKDVDLTVPFEQKRIFVLMNDGWSAQ